MSLTMKKGPVIAVVGPSGVGKDSLMGALRQADPGVHLMRRVITRAPEAGGEDYTPVTEAEFLDLAGKGAFALHWPAHGLHYGIPKEIESLRAGATAVLVNLSRGVLLEAQGAFDDFRVLSVTARPEVLAARLAARGREDAAEVQRRLARAGKPLPAGLAKVHEIDNSGDMGAAVMAARAAIQPVRA
ncbi:phosphonate metabolism protein/1,5-bisphosphokinase (PRPP-forming) PhnN [Phaeobacter sp. QD34_3]|uniref:phosphonate metabolism protein/1,5-bisphosphokinase (PRPP-forming) PhnN n=1 Tax=unclassified Phaeobacter TaxID=2621772 RepID=UPI00237F54D7|nr:MULTISPECIES: phosphonate metabolism protein/1,5-bisphosphokinase (PRPP-forming) PhnN [unclassified Phaeobacter]MDE4133117.1 phosphonate metabolism protein/1,5-bisphosphokinase (PRPP-forming) PhnN [Phaeobacter sp. QD34_3]MDE4136813.1 phosphonate metabolism protein/1,5-bisphosphokinase (PRPP-forming) PhnN [Phaeobacter sp. QD34_24]